MEAALGRKRTVTFPGGLFADFCLQPHHHHHNKSASHAWLRTARHTSSLIPLTFRPSREPVKSLSAHLKTRSRINNRTTGAIALSDECEPSCQSSRDAASRSMHPRAIRPTPGNLEHSRPSVSRGSTTSATSQSAAGGLANGQHEMNITIERRQSLGGRPLSQHMSKRMTPGSAQMHAHGFHGSMDGAGLDQISRFNRDQGVHQLQDDSARSSVDPNGFMDFNMQDMTPDPETQPPTNTKHNRKSTGSFSAADAPAKSRAVATTAANEKELRELLAGNKSRSLESIAQTVRSSDRPQKTERQKQLYALRWLQDYCVQSNQSVPRSRVYAHYANRCGTDRVEILNSASFGKLVRIIFPGIQTRRLGVRGESKYHYVNLQLREEGAPGDSTRAPSPQASMEYQNRAQSYDAESERPTTSRLPLDTSAFPPDAAEVDNSINIASESNPPSQGMLFTNPFALGLPGDHQQPPMVVQTLRFTPSIHNTSEDTMTLPSIFDFAPAKTDHDTAEALTALYRTHCTSLCDAVRFVREKQFSRLLGSFSGTLTVPVTRLFTHPDLAPWIKLCDWYMYQQIVRFLSQLVLQVIPMQVINMLSNLSNNLTNQITKNFGQYPEHVLQAKLEPTTIFASLIQRLLRVNESAHAAANLLTNDQLRNAMWADWVQCVKPKRVVETELPECGHREVFHILTRDVRKLLEPLDQGELTELGTDFEQTRMETDQDIGPIETTAEGTLDRWASFLQGLPSRFPQMATRTLLHCMSSVSTAALRDITVNQAQSFGAWWITKVWVDEMMLWYAEVGGFLQPRSPGLFDGSPTVHQSRESGILRPDRPGQNGQLTNGLGIDMQGSSMFGSGPQIGNRSATEPPTGTFHHNARVHKASNLSFELHDDAHDDSGIGMTLMDGDLPGHFDYASFHDHTTQPLIGA